MKDLEKIREEILNGEKFYLRNISIDNVILGYHNKQLKVLLQRPQGISDWTVSGGYINRTETIEEAASRIATERTGLENLYLKQFKAFGSPLRNIDGFLKAKSLKYLDGLEIDKASWIFDYFVTLGYYTLTEFDMVKPTGEFYAEDCQWWDILNLPPLIIDHKLIIEEALKTLRLDIYHYPIGYELLPEKFTLPEITSLYETILEKKLDDRNFAKKLRATGIITKLNDRRYIGPHRSPFLYVFNKDKYDEALKNGMVLAI
jgi:ADP-ribose pyrophosphatase YjhB (NUDIX family)